MIRKKLWWGLFVILSGLLIYGAVYRTVMKAGDSILPGARSNTPHSQGWQNNEDGDTETTRLNANEEGHEVPVDWVQLEGEASQVDARTLLVISGDGASVLVERGAWRFALEQGFVISVGDSIRLVGFYENGDFEVVEMINLTNQSYVALRDAAGKPVWSGDNRN